MSQGTVCAVGGVAGVCCCCGLVCFVFVDRLLHSDETAIAAETERGLSFSWLLDDSLASCPDSFDRAGVSERRCVWLCVMSVRPVRACYYRSQSCVVCSDG